MFPRRVALGLAVAVALLVPPGVVAAAQPPAGIMADLAGRPIELASVARYHCHDFDYPRIHCFATAEELGAAVGPVVEALGPLTVTATNYVLIFEHSLYAGASMYVSQDYTVLAFIGWNDRISSFRALNGETGSFHWDWFYGGGTPYTFCCNQSVSSLGSWNDAISSVRRT